MKQFKLFINLLIQLLICLLFFSNINASNFNKNLSTKDISNYFSGVISLNDNEYANSYKFFKKIEGLGKNHPQYSKA